MTTPEQPTHDSTETVQKLKTELKAAKEEWTAVEEPLLRTKSLKRYLRATEGNLSKSKQMVLDTLKWRKEMGIDLWSAAQVEKHFKQGKNYHYGKDKNGRPIAVMRCNRDSSDDPDGKLRVMLYQIERAIRLMDKDVEQAVWLVDCSGFASYFLGPGHISMAMSLISALTNHYPERLGALYIVNAPWIFNAFWKMVIPFVQKATAKKFLFIKNKTELQDLIDIEHLEKDFGGTSDHEYVHDVYFKMLLEEETTWREKNVRILTPAETQSPAESTAN